jgi:hypothetical protein
MLQYLAVLPNFDILQPRAESPAKEALARETLQGSRKKLDLDLNVQRKMLLTPIR